MRGDWLSFHTSACSRPPLPITRTFIRRGKTRLGSGENCVKPPPGLYASDLVQRAIYQSVKGIDDEIGKKRVHNFFHLGLLWTRTEPTNQFCTHESGEKNNQQCERTNLNRVLPKNVF